MKREKQSFRKQKAGRKERLNEDLSKFPRRDTRNVSQTGYFQLEIVMFLLVCDNLVGSAMVYVLGVYYITPVEHTIRGSKFIDHLWFCHGVKVSQSYRLGK